MAKAICAVVRAECPRTNDPQAKIFCPWWSQNLPDTLIDGSYRLSIGNPLVGCSIPLIFRYLVSGIAEADHAHAAANQARDAALEVKESLNVAERSIRGALLPPLMESLLGKVERANLAIAEKSETQ